MPIPTAHGDQIQKAVNEYIASRIHYNVVINDCADFINDAVADNCTPMSPRRRNPQMGYCACGQR